MVADSVNAAVLMTESFYMQDISRFDKFTVKAYNRYLFVPQHAPLQHFNLQCKLTVTVIMLNLIGIT